MVLHLVGETMAGSQSWAEGMGPWTQQLGGPDPADESDLTSRAFPFWVTRIVPGIDHAKKATT